MTARRLHLVWLVLAAVTIVTTWALSKHQVSFHIALSATFVLVGLKVWLLIEEFMELRHAPLAARLALGSWACGVPLLIITLAW